MLTTGLVIANIGLGDPSDRVLNLDEEQREQLGAIEIIVSDTKPKVASDVTILCPFTQKDPDFPLEAIKNALTSNSAVKFPVSGKNVRLLTEESIVNSLTTGGKLPIIWIKKETLSEEAKNYEGKTYLVFAPERLCFFTGSREIAEKAYPCPLRNGSLKEGVSSYDLERFTVKGASPEKIRKRNAILRKVREFITSKSEFLIEEYEDFLDKVQIQGTPESVIIYDEVETMNKLDSEGTLRMNTNCTGLRCTYIEYAAFCGSNKCFKWIMQHGGKINANLVSFAQNGECTPKRMEIIRIIEQNGVTIKLDEQFIKFVPMEFVAWLSSHPEFDVNSLLSCACKYNRLDIVLCFIDKCSEENYGNVLTMVVSMRLLDTVRFLIEECGYDVESESDEGMAALHEACGYGYLDIVKYLVEKRNCDVNIQDCFLTAPLYWACKYGHLDVVKYLVEERNCELDTKNEIFQTTPLHMACRGGRLELVKYLVEECHYNAEEKDNRGRTALYWACKYGHLDIVKYLVEECHCNAEVEDKKGRIPLYWACQYGHLEVVKYLVEECHCDAEKRDDYGCTASQVAHRGGHLDIVNYLLKQQKEQKSNQNQ